LNKASEAARVWRVTVAEEASAIELLTAASGLPKGRIKDAMNKGAVWLESKGKGRRRLRRATARLRPGDRLGLHYDPELLARTVAAPVCVLDQRRYSLWDKPAGMMSQGTDFGDHCSLPHWVERHFDPPRQVLLVHRLDREASGLMLLAHDRHAAARFSALFADGAVYKRYRVEVRGDLADPGAGMIEVPLDGKPACTRYRCLGYDVARDTSLLDVEIDTGRLHQIRRHLDAIGHPVMGDPRYGSGNKNQAGLRLRAIELRFPCPVTRREVGVVLDDCSRVRDDPDQK
jgi:tRNA pseudouridine32 synthase/23S rRNA pseudouridine746 synthase